MTTAVLIQLCYLAASVLFILGLRGLGMQLRRGAACAWPSLGCCSPLAAPCCDTRSSATSGFSSASSSARPSGR